MALKKIILAAICAALVLSAGSRTSADQSCSLTRENFDALKATENDYSLDYLARIQNELMKRKELLGEVVQCAINEAVNLQSDLNNLNANGLDAQKLQSQLSNQLLNAINYYQTQKSKISGLGLQGSRDFAKDLAAWRAGNYNSTAKRISNFIIWNQNQPLIKTAKDRVQRLGQTVNLLSIVGSDQIQSLWKGASDNFNSAIEWNDAAKESLEAFGPGDESSNAIQSSLEALSKTYQELLDTISAVNKALSI